MQKLRIIAEIFVIPQETKGKIPKKIIINLYICFRSGIGWCNFTFTEKKEKTLVAVTKRKKKGLLWGKYFLSLLPCYDNSITTKRAKVNLLLTSATGMPTPHALLMACGWLILFSESKNNSR